MTTDEAARLHLLEQARSALGAEAAHTLMSSLPRDPDHAATKADLALLKADVALLGTELRSEMAVLSAELRGEMAQLRGEMTGMGGEIVQRLFFAIVATNATLVGLVLAAVKLA